MLIRDKFLLLSWRSRNSLTMDSFLSLGTSFRPSLNLFTQRTRHKFKFSGNYLSGNPAERDFEVVIMHTLCIGDIQGVSEVTRIFYRNTRKAFP